MVGESLSTAAPGRGGRRLESSGRRGETPGLRHGTAAVALSEEGYMTEVTVAGPAGENVQVIDKTDR